MTEQRRLIPIKLDGYKPLRDIVFETLREAIINQTLKPGERLMEIQLAEEMGVSRTPVREAIRKLELEGLVVMSCAVRWKLWLPVWLPCASLMRN